MTDRLHPTTGKFIPVEEAATEWFKNPEFCAAYEAQEEKFARAEALIKARALTQMTQEQMADLSVPETKQSDLKNNDIKDLVP